MAKSPSIGNYFLFLIVVAALFPGCRKERNIWKPEGVLVMKPDSGLTTQTFDFRGDIGGYFYARCIRND